MTDHQGSPNDIVAFELAFEDVGRRLFPCSSLRVQRGNDVRGCARTPGPPVRARGDRRRGGRDGIVCALAQTGGLGRLWEVSIGGRIVAVAPSLGAALDILERAICMRIIARHPDLIAMHGATLLTRDGAAFVCGPSGAGKSTLALAMAARGYSVGGDDVALLDPRDDTIWPVPRCFHLDARSRRLLRGAGLTMPAFTRRDRFMTPADLGVIDPPASPIRLLLFLGRDSEQAARLAPLCQAEMFVRLLSETTRGGRSPGQLMGALRPSVTRTRCYQLMRGRLSDTALTVAELLATA